MYQIGAGKADITILKENVGLMGYGVHWNIGKTIGTRLHARAFVIRNSEKTVVFVNAEICFPTIIMKHAALQKLAAAGYSYEDAGFILTAQHTHSAPGGYSHYFFYNMTVTGHHKEVFDTYVKGIVEAVIQAEQNCQSSKIHLNKGTFGKEVPIAFNRSIKPYNKNPEVTRKLGKDETHLAVDREMKLLRFDNNHGKTIGTLNWFGVHTTSVSNDNTKINFDNKGFAAQYFEDDLAEKNSDDPPPITVFAQDVAGDVTPNFIWDKKKKWTRGKYEDDFESAQFHGKLQYEKAKDIYEKTPEQGEEIVGDIDFVSMYVDFSNVKVDEDFTGGASNQRTTQPCIGIAFLQGTKEGPGLPKAIGNVVRFGDMFVKAYRKYIFSNFMPYKERVAMMHMYKAQHPKTVVLEMGEGRVMGTKRVRNLIVPAFADPVIKYFKHLDREGITRQTPWEPEVLQIQIVVIGQLAIVGIPAEITTIAGQRLRKTIADVLKERGVTEVMLSPYANGYSGYITTYEEYQCQAYEGGHTVFGKWTLAAYQTKFSALAKELIGPSKDRKRQESEDQMKGPRFVEEEKIWYGFKDKSTPVVV